MIVSRVEDIPCEEMRKDPAVRRYLERGGVLRVEGCKIVYPSKGIVEERLKELYERKRELTRKSVSLRGIDLLRIRHRIALFIDKEYRDIVERVGIDDRFFRSRRGRKIVEALLSSKGYREEVKKVLDEGISGFGRSVVVVEDIKREIKEAERKKKEEILKEVEEDIEMYRRLMRWM